MKQDIALNLIITLVDQTKEIKAGDHNKINEYLTVLKKLQDLKLDHADILILRNKLTGVKSLMPLLDVSPNQKIIINILQHLKKSM